MKNSLFLVLLLSLFACQTEVKSLYGLPVETIDLYRFPVVAMDELPAGVWEEEEYILLTAGTSEELFARAKKIRVQDDKIYILDKRRRDHFLLVYKMDGTALGCVGQKGNGPGEYIHITDFDVAADGTVYMMDAYMGSVVLHQYDPDFQFVRKVDLPFQADLFMCLPDGGFFFSLSTWNTGLSSGRRNLITDTELNVLYSEMEYGDEYDDSYWLSGYLLIRREDGISLHRPIEDYIYLLDRTGRPEKIYEVDFGKYTVPSEARKDVENHLADFENYKYLHEFVWVNDQYMIGKINDQLNIRMFVADRVNRICYQSEPIQEFEYTCLIGYEDGYFISYIEPDRYLFDQDDFDYLPAHVKTHLAADNPVLTLRRLQGM